MYVNLSVKILFVITVLLSIITYFIQGIDGIIKGYSIALNNMLGTVILVVLAFLIVGLFGKVINKNKISECLGASAGNKGAYIGISTGLLFPGGPYGYYPVIKQLIDSGAAPPAIFGFLSSKFLLGIARIPLEIGLIGPWPAIVRHLVCIPFPFIISYFAAVLSKTKYFSVDNIFIKSQK